jgi:cyclopropane-fatty-acyl-phospholipid synthase
MKTILHAGYQVVGPRLSVSTSVDLLSTMTERIGDILSRRKLGLFVTLRGSSVFVGHDDARLTNPPEFLLDSEATLIRLFERMSLFDFALAYIDGHMKIGGPIAKAVEILDVMNLSTDRSQTASEYLRLAFFRLSKAAIPAIARRFESLEHYDRSAAAYELFLDPWMQYTCGYFESPQDSVEAAQIAKFRLIKELAENHVGPLRGKEHLDIGCGWGGLGAYFEREHGVRSLGLTNSPQQLEFARRHFGVDVFFGDFLDLRRTGRTFDLITVVGMIEHLTPKRRVQLLSMIADILNSGGIFYLQCIAKPSIWVGGDAYRVTQREVFPGHYLETAQETERRLSHAGFMILERMEHCEHYGLTTSRWVEKIEANEQSLISLLGPREYRTYLGYLAFASRMFLSGRGSLMRYVLRKS